MQKIFYINTLIALLVSTNLFADTTAYPTLLEVWTQAFTDIEPGHYNKQELQTLRSMISGFKKTHAFKTDWIKYKQVTDFDYQKEAYAQSQAWFAQEICRNILRGIYFQDRTRNYSPRPKRKPYHRQTKTLQKTVTHHRCFIRHLGDYTLELQWKGVYFEKISTP